MGCCPFHNTDGDESSDWGLGAPSEEVEPFTAADAVGKECGVRKSPGSSAISYGGQKEWGPVHGERAQTQVAILSCIMPRAAGIS